MASPPGHPPSQYEPAGRWGHSSAIVYKKKYTYGGHCGAGGVPTLTAVDIFDFETELWQQTPTLGEPPPGYYVASCAVIGAHIFHFGGFNPESGYYNTIHSLDTINLTWSTLPATNPQEAPMCKNSAGILVYANILVIAGGYGDSPDHPHPDKYVPDPGYEGRGWTNEVHCFHVDSSELC